MDYPQVADQLPVSSPASSQPSVEVVVMPCSGTNSVSRPSTVQEEHPIELMPKVLTSSPSEDEVVVDGSFMLWSQTNKIGLSSAEGAGGEAGWPVRGVPRNEPFPGRGEVAGGEAGRSERGRGPNAPNGIPNKPPNTCRRFHRPNMTASSIGVNAIRSLVVRSLAILLVPPRGITVVPKRYF